jgi:hypothetical protein
MSQLPGRSAKQLLHLRAVGCGETSQGFQEWNTEGLGAENENLLS